MHHIPSRRAVLGAAAGFAARAAAPSAPLIDTHIHLFASDQARFPYHRHAVYKPPPRDVDEYGKQALAAGISHAVIVHPEPYQDDHSYLEFCFAREPRPGFFKGTCLLDPLAPETPARLEELVGRLPHRLIALRIHATADPKDYPNSGPAIRDRDLGHPRMAATWAKAHSLGLAIQMHLIPWYAPAVRALGIEYRQGLIILDHLARSGFGTPAQFEEVMAMAALPNVIMKFSGVSYSSRESWPHRDVKLLVQRIFREFGPDRMMWGGLGMDAAEFTRNRQMFDEMFAFASAADRARIQGGTARRLFRFQETAGEEIRGGPFPPAPKSSLAFCCPRAFADG